MNNQATIQKKWNFYSLEYKDWEQNKVEINSNIFHLIEMVEWKVGKLLIKYI